MLSPSWSRSWTSCPFVIYKESSTETSSPRWKNRPCMLHNFLTHILWKSIRASISFRALIFTQAHLFRRIFSSPRRMRKLHWRWSTSVCRILWGLVSDEGHEAASLCFNLLTLCNYSLFLFWSAFIGFPRLRLQMRGWTTSLGAPTTSPLKSSGDRMGLKRTCGASAWSRISCSAGAALSGRGRSREYSVPSSRRIRTSRSRHGRPCPRRPRTSWRGCWTRTTGREWPPPRPCVCASL